MQCTTVDVFVCFESDVALAFGGSHYFGARLHAPMIRIEYALVL